MSRSATAAGGLATVLAAPILLVLLVGIGDAADPPAAACQPHAGATLDGLDPEQARNAGVIVAVGQAADVPDLGLQVALATAMQESELRNLDHGDQDSVGLFQQRPSTGWGTPTQPTDPVYAAQAFYGGPTGPNRGEPPGLLDLEGWQHMTLTDAAQAVQRSAHPNAYARWEHPAAGWLADLLTADGDPCIPGGGLACPPTGLAAEDGLTPGALQVVRCIATHFPQVTIFHGVGDRPNDSDHPAGRAVDAMVPNWATQAGKTLGWEIADWVRAHHVCLGVTYVIWDARIWSPGDDAWRPYQHPNGWTDANSLHRNHVHVSVTDDSGACVAGAWVVPIRGDYTITARYGQTGAHWTSSHTGVDLAAPTGRDVLAAAGGKVTSAGWDGPYGLKIEITHADGTRSLYAHLSSMTAAHGAYVTAGDLIGHVGSTGNTTGPHLHFEIRPAPHGQPIDPRPWMASRGAPL